MKAIIISISSDIGVALAEQWLAEGWQVLGTYRTKSDKTQVLEAAGAKLVACDMGQPQEVAQAAQALTELVGSWDVLVFCVGTQQPIGPFASRDFAAWESGVDVNFTRQLQMLHAMLPARNRQCPEGPLALFFAGGGTNNATVNYSSYTISKIALIKMCELLDAEVPDTRFSIVGPGWVKTKIHEETLAAPKEAGANYARAQEKLKGDTCTPMQEVVDCCRWIVRMPRTVVSGRNISVVYDCWDTQTLEEKLSANTDMYKLRRAGNELLVREST